MLRWCDSIPPWRISKNVQRKLGSVDNQEWTNSLLLDYLPNKPMHIQRMFILLIVIKIIIHSNKFFCLQNSVLPDNHGSQWEQYYNLWSIINITFFHSIHLLLLFNFIKDYRCEQIIMLVYYLQISWMVDWLYRILEQIEDFKECQTCFHSSLNRLYHILYDC